ncbi:autophagy protein Apg17-domain-containing protein [Vararia minispora EC-137]|uniref:Autophagy protein Apg17-domain-containing protein n=1 Tax=Vararia minispora EC-137 TaxID=1314806 RepID=A0ACB8QMK5_9AGAM|nr:autophagy protein Apg17-domain-containing protein [Vararia minispora EC-137]
MASPPSDPHDRGHLASLALQSKKALQQGEALCSRANALSVASAQEVFNVLALSAKVRWISDAVMEQLKLAACVAKDIEERRSRLEAQAQAWDIARSQQTGALDTILESLGRELVPPSFHEVEIDVSLFGSQSSDSEEERPTPATSPDRSPTLTIRGSESKQQKRKKKAEARLQDRSRWKSLRDFVDEHAIESEIEIMENERSELDKTLTVTAAYPHTLQDTLYNIEEGLPPKTPSTDVTMILTSQDNVSESMAQQLESLAQHYDQMERSLSDSEAGHVFEADDLMEMNRDTEELPVIIDELEDAYNSIHTGHDELRAAKRTAYEHLAQQRGILDDLIELGSIMGEMLQRQTEVELDFESRLEVLNQHLFILGDVSHQYTLYQHSYRKLLVEVARRRHYTEAADQIVRGTMSQLAAMAEEERQLREDFNTEHGKYLPSDICFFVENMPTRWEVTPLKDDAIESLPDIPADLVALARDAPGIDERSPVGVDSV